MTTPSSSLTLPFGLRDPAFQERIWMIKRAQDAGLAVEDWHFLREPLVAAWPFEVYTHCPRGRMAEHPCADSDRPGFIARACMTPGCCGSSWIVRR